MLSKTIALAAILFFASCNDEKKPTDDASPASNTESPASGSTDKAAEIEQLNAQSKACIRLMNTMEEAQNSAIAAGDQETAAACKKTIDSAARENVKIGQRLMELQ